MLAITSCSNNKRNKNNPVFNNSSITNEDSSSIFSAPVTAWLNNNLKTKPESRKIMLEESWEDDSLQKEEFLPENSFYKNYQSVLHWSVDSNYILDVGSYGLAAVQGKNGKIELQAEEPDTEIALIDVKDKERIRLMSVGPSSTILSGRWLTDREALVLGTFLNEDQRTDTLLWFINVNDNVFRLYNIKSH